MLKDIIKLHCDKCGAEFAEDMDYAIDGVKEKSLKEKLLSGKFFDHICPNCKNTVYHLSELTYYDSDKKYLIRANNIIDNFLYRDAIENDRFKGYSVYSVIYPNELYQLVRILDNDLDYRIATLYREYSKYNYKKVKNIKDKNIVAYLYCTKDEDELILIYVDDDKNEVLDYEDFNYEKYNKLVDSNNWIINNTDPYYFTKSALIKAAADEDYHYSNIDYYIVRVGDDSTIVYSIKLDEINYKEGEEVIFKISSSGRSDIYKGVIEKKIETKYDRLLLDEDNMGVIIAKSENKNFIFNTNNLKDCDDYLELSLKAFDIFEHNCDLFPYEEMNETKLYLVKDSNNNYLKTKIKKEEYINIYLNEPNDESNYQVSSMIDLVKLFILSLNEKSNGINIIGKEYKVVLKSDELYEYSIKNILNIRSNTKNYILNLNKIEKDLLKHREYEYVYRAYVLKEPKPKIFKDMNLSQKEIFSIIMNVFKRLGDIILTELFMKKIQN